MDRYGSSTQPEAWLRGPIEGVPPLLMPVAHALLQSAEDAERAVEGLEVGLLWMRPGGAASVGFHLRHIVGVVDRLFTYARGRPLDSDQLLYLQTEGEPGNPPVEAELLLDRLRRAVDRAVDELRSFRSEELLEPREVGRKKLPSNVLGLLVHAAEHAQRHTGQIVATSRIVRVAGRSEPRA